MSPGPQATRSTIVATLGIVLGAALLVGSALGASGADDMDRALHNLNLAVGGIIVAGAAELSWLSAGRQSVRRLRDRVVDVYSSLDTMAPLAAPTTSFASSTERVMVAGSTWHHRPDCRLVAGKDAASVPKRATHLTACRICED